MSKACRAGIPVPPPAKGKTKESTRVSAERDYEKGQSGENQEPSPRASRAREEVLKREPRSTVSHQALSRQAKTASRSRSGKERHDAAAKAVRTKSKSGLQKAAKKASNTRARRRAA